MTTLFQYRFYRVENKNKHHNAEDFYYFCTDVDGNNYLFTTSALLEARERAKKNLEDIPKDLAILNPEQVLMDKDHLEEINTECEKQIEATEKSKSTSRYMVVFCCIMSCIAGFLMSFLF